MDNVDPLPIEKSDTPTQEKEVLAKISLGLPIPLHYKIDPDKITAASEAAELYYITRIREACKSPSAWRAAAWWLERRYPKFYGNTKPENLDEKTVQHFLEKLVSIIAAHTDPETHKKIIDGIIEVLKE